MEEIRIRGARTHNLKNINLDLPRNKLIVITGLSGSGKSSLAFDTLYAEGQRRYVESLSAYARQFLQLMEKPDVDLIEGLSPAISIEQKATSHNPRSTVGTVTEIHDYLRLLYARVGTPYCPDHPERPLAAQIGVADGRRVLAHAGGHQADDPGAGGRQPQGRARRSVRGDAGAGLRALSRAERHRRAKIYEVDDLPKLKKTEKHTIDVVIDRIKVKRRRSSSAWPRVFETALRLADGRAMARGNGQRQRALYSNKFACPTAAIRCRNWSRACSRSTTRWAPARNATASAISNSSIRKRIVAFPNLSLASRRGQGLGPAQPVLFPDAVEPGRALRVRSRHAVREAARRRRSNVVLYGSGTADDPVHLHQRARPHRGARAHLRRRGQQPAAALPRNRFDGGARKNWPSSSTRRNARPATARACASKRAT